MSTGEMSIGEKGGGDLETAGRPKRPLLGLLIAQSLGTINDNAWKQIVVLLAIAGAANSEEGQRHTALAQIVLLVPMVLVSLPAGMLADRLSKRSVIVAMKVFELAILLVGTLALMVRPGGGVWGLAVLALFGVEFGLVGPAKYGIMPEILPHEKLSAGNGLLEMVSNLSIIIGIVAGGAILSLANHFGLPIWTGGAMLATLAALGLGGSLLVPHVPAARSEGGPAASARLAWSSIRSDRILRLALMGQAIVWAVASLVPATVLPYAKQDLQLPEWQAGLPLAALGVGIGLGCVLAGKLSGPIVEHGLLPLGALGLALGAIAFAAIGPGFIGTMIAMSWLGVFSGLLFVPLNALLQWRAPDDRRGAVIAFVNTLVYVGMLLGSALALGLAALNVSPRGTFLGLAFALAAGFLWALSLVPSAFLRFVLLGLAHTVYRVRVLGRENVPSEGGALLVPNHVSFADGLFLFASIDRPIRFVVYAPYFDRPILGTALRLLRAIPISATGGPKMVLHAFREAGQALDNGELVCIFPEGQLTRTGMMAPFQRGLQRIVKGRTTPIVPIHLDRLMGSVLSPASHRRWPTRIPYPVTVSIGRPLPPDASLHTMRQTISELGEEAWAYRKADRRPLHHEFVRQARRHPRRLAFADLQTRRVSYFQALAGALALARELRADWKDQWAVGVMLPSSVAGALVNLAAALAGKTVVHLNFTTGRAGLESAASQAKLRSVITSRGFLERAKIEPPGGVRLIFAEDVRARIGAPGRFAAAFFALVAPVRRLERFAGAERPVDVDDVATIIFSSGSTGEPKGVVLSHFNIDSNVQAIQEAYRVLPDDRLVGILPLFHSFGYAMFWFAANSGMGAVCHPSPLDAAAIGGLIERYAATILLATPTFLQLYLRRCAPAQFGSIRLVLAGAEKLSESLALAFEDAFGIRPLEGYGMTECAPVVAVNTLDHREPGSFQPGARRGHVGRPLPGVAVRIVDRETYAPLESGAEGLVLVKGPNVMRGYLGRDDLTAAAFHDGWYITGDLGHLGDDGFLKISGRLARFSKIGGEMVPHGRVEEALHQAIGMEEQVFAVTAVADPGKGEKLVVLHVLDDEQVDRALSGLRARGLPNLFIPRRDLFVKVNAVPVLGTGKLDLKAMRQLAEEALGGTRAELEPEPVGAEN